MKLRWFCEDLKVAGGVQVSLRQFDNGWRWPICRRGRGTSISSRSNPLSKPTAPTHSTHHA